METKKIDNFLRVIQKNPPGGCDNWPLSGSQILSYFETDQALGIYDRVNMLLKKGDDYNQIGKCFERPSILRLFLAQTGIVGIKNASTQGKRKISVNDRVRFFNDLESILETMVTSDPFCSDYKNVILKKEEIDKLKHEITWLEIDKQNKRFFLEVGVDLYHFIWSFYYNLFVNAGYEIHGPYEYEEGGKRYKLVIRENFDMNPKEVWGFDTGLPPIKLFLLYEGDTDFKLNLFNQPISEGHNEKLIRVALQYDKKFIANQKVMARLMDNINQFSLKMTKKVESLSKRDQVRKGAELSFYMYRGIYRVAGDNWRPDQIMDNSFKENGDRFITGNILRKKRTRSEWVKFMDIRNDYS